MTYIPSRINEFNTNIAAATRVAQATTLFDGKTLGTDDTELWENVGTGTATFLENKVTLSGTAGQYMIRQAIRTNPYFSGKTQLVEFTFDSFQTEGDAIKRVSYYSSSTVAPYDTNFDGFFIENNGGAFKLKVYRAGTLTLNIAFADMDNYDKIASYDWSTFTVCAFDFLWLGGAGLRFFVKVGGAFELIHTFNYAGTASDIFMLSPNQPIRYELRCISNSASFRCICSQVATEGSVDEAGKITSFFNPTQLATNTNNVNYALLSIRKRVGFENIATEIAEIGVIGGGSTDTGILYLVKNPTLSAPLSYVNAGKIQVAYGTTQTITAGSGTVICAVPTSAGSFPATSNIMKNNVLAKLSSKLATASTPDEFVLVYRPLTTNQTNSGIITVKEY